MVNCYTIDYMVSPKKINLNNEKYCPTCGKPMDFIKSKEDHDNNKPFNRWEIWKCLNCNEEWEVDLLKNMLHIEIKH